MSAASVADEIRRLNEGPLPEEVCGGIGTIALVGLCDDNPQLVACRVREVLRVVLDIQSKPWPTETEWRCLLPSWFVAACAPEMTHDEAEQWLKTWRTMTVEQRADLDATQRWSLADWLHWLQPSERQWEFWECRVSDEHAVRLAIKLDAWPIAHGALDWLIRAAGANRVIAEPD
ncbi:MAG: hypothetical protein Q8J93_11070 [Xanthomonadales bacterium]|nr:hypothetical protein [Xanthomonadales bacterium]MDZ4115330.1 hypothetical protein [Xanthomonadaceae bacterium]MDZ4376813.1 hypothetical protein [Xanthomonadaceae bacterium]